MTPEEIQRRLDAAIAAAGLDLAKAGASAVHARVDPSGVAITIDHPDGEVVATSLDEALEVLGELGAASAESAAPREQTLKAALDALFERARGVAAAEGYDDVVMAFYDLLDELPLEAHGVSRVDIDGEGYFEDAAEALWRVKATDEGGVTLRRDQAAEVRRRSMVMLPLALRSAFERADDVQSFAAAHDLGELAARARPGESHDKLAARLQLRWVDEPIGPAAFGALRAADASPATYDRAAALRAGMGLSHPKFGYGVVLGANDGKARIQFTDRVRVLACG